MAWQQILQTSADAELDFFFGGIEVNEFRQLQILSVELRQSILVVSVGSTH